jgi:hypothetical protein
VSPIGPNDVSYPVLVTDKNVYILAEEKVVARARFPSDWNTDVLWETATDLYYSMPVGTHFEGCTVLHPRITDWSS